MKGSIGFARGVHSDWSIDVGDVVTVMVELTSEEVRTMRCPETRSAFNGVISEVLRDLPRVNLHLEDPSKGLRELLGMSDNPFLR